MKDGEYLHEYVNVLIPRLYISCLNDDEMFIVIVYIPPNYIYLKKKYVCEIYMDI